MLTCARPTTLRELISEKLLDTGVERSLETQELERNISRIPQDRPGLQIAQYAVRSAKRRNAFRLWLGWRLRSRHFTV